MVGYIVYTEENRGLRLKRRRIGGVVLLEVSLGKGGRLRERMNARRAAKELAKRRIREAVFPVDYPHGDLFARKGILPVDTLPLYRAMAPEIVKQRLRQLEFSAATTTAAITAERMTAEVGTILRELAMMVRYVMLSADGGEELCAQLRREYGVSVIRQPQSSRIDGADVLLLLRPPEKELKQENPVLLHLYDGERVLQRNGITFSLPRRLLEQVEENCDQKQLLQVLLREGMLQNYQIPIMEVDIPKKSYYNASTVNNIE